MRAFAAGLTDIGLRRERNDDAFGISTDRRAFVVADGMSGRGLAGDVASKVATETILEFLHKAEFEDVTSPFRPDPRLSKEESDLQAAVQLANKEIFVRSMRSQERVGMGSTVVCAAFSPRTRAVCIGNVGDSRCYRIREGRMDLLTRDHSLESEYAQFGRKPDEAVASHVLTRALGLQDAVSVDIQTETAKVGDTYLLCTDGLTRKVRDDEIEEVLARSADPDEACRVLVQLANARGGEDNVTVIVVQIREDATGRTARPSAAARRSPDIGNGTIFVSYRRDDSADVTGRIVDKLVTGLGRDAVFRDVDNIPLGVDVRKFISDQVQCCGLLLAVIGPSWRDAKDTFGRRRLDDPGDFVRIEIEAALARAIPVVPILVGGASMPEPSSLPSEVQALAYRNGVSVRRDPDFHGDMNRLIAGLTKLLQ